MTSRVQKIAPPALDPEHFRRLAHDTVDLVADYLAGISARPVFLPMTPAERAALMQEPLGAAGVGPEVLLERVRAAVLPHAMGNGHPRFFGWVNSPPAPVGVLADLLAAALNPSCAGGDHAAIYVERAAVRWLMELIGFPTEGSMGLLASGGSAATLIALAAARHRAAIDDGWNVRRDGLQRARSPFVLYASQEGHSCIQKAAELLGLGTDAIQRIATDENYRMDVGALRGGSILRSAFSLVPDYLRTEPDRGFGGLPWYSEFGVQQTRGFRALKLWMTFQHLGRDGVRDLIARHLVLARYLAELVDAAPDLERLAAVELSIVCFRYAPTRLRGDAGALDALNERLMQDVQASGEAFLTQTTLGGRFALRACVLHYATTEADVAALVDVVRETGARLASTGPSIPPEHGKEQEQGGDQKEAARDGA